MNDILSLAITGAAVSVLVQFIKSSVGTSGLKTVGIVAVLSLVGGAVYYQFGNTALWQASLQVLVYANAVYGFIIKRFESAS
jgi:hypothetical protein